MTTTYVILVAILAVSAAIAAAVWVAERLDPPPPDPAGPAGGQHTARHAADQKAGPDLDALTPGPVGTGWLEPLPGDDPADITGVQPAATCYLGMPSEQYVDELFSKHAEAQQ